MKIATSVFILCIATFFAGCNIQNSTKDNQSDKASQTTSATETAATDLTQASDLVHMNPEYAKTMARMAYIWGYPLVNTLNRSKKITEAPKPGLLGGILPVAPMGQLAMLHDYIDPGQTFVACPNQDVVYGMGFFSLNKQPVVLQVPDAGDRFYIYSIYDGRTDQTGEIGTPYGTESGFYLLHGPDWKGEIPKAITGTIKSPTALACVVPRVFMDDTKEDREAIQKIINQIMAYPLTEFTGQMKTTNWKELPTIPAPNTGSKGKGETKWVVPEKFFDVFGEVLSSIPPQPGEEALYSQFRAMMKIADENAQIKKAMTDAVVELDKTMVKDFLLWKYNGKPAGNGWNRSQNNAQWGLDYYNRISTSRSNIFENRPNETQYFYTDKTSSGEQLKGSNNYKITFNSGQLPPVQGFWSVTLYNKEHLFYPNELKRYSLGSKNKTLTHNADGSLTLYAGTQNPGKDKEANWLPAPADNFSLYIRAYWGKKEIIDGSWQPPVIEQLSARTETP